MRFTYGFASIACFSLIGCAGIDTRLPEISAPDLAAETQCQETRALRQIETDTAKLLDVAWPILRANAELCPKAHLSLGVKTHSLESYPKRFHDSAGRILGADETPRVFQIAKNSPASQAGLMRNDVMLNESGEPIDMSFSGWNTIMASGSLTVQRGGDTIELPIKPALACNYGLKLSTSSAINAYADGRNITLTTAMMTFVENENELALIIGHELGHNTMGHIRKSIGNFILSLGATRYTRPFESEADYVGLYYLVRAGYSADGVEAFWQRLAGVSPKGINRAKTHPTFPDRYLRIRAGRDEIEKKQKAGEPLIPNFLTKDKPSNT